MPKSEPTWTSQCWLLSTLSLILPFLTGLAGFADDKPIGIRVPDGFEVSLFADDALAHDIYSMTIDSQGRVVVAGAGFVKILVDTDGDGRADQAKQFADRPGTGSQGMYFLGPDLICTGDAGLLRFRDRDGDDKADGPPDVFLRIKSGGEHDAHSVQKGPDGWWYILSGNNAGVTKKYVTLNNSPVQEPEHGTLMRLKPNLAGGEVVAHGYRNAYDFAFNPLGDIFVYDSDGERDVTLPWWRPTRVFQALPTSHAGWYSRSWKRPDHFADMPPVVGSFGRGCPTGVVCYRHRQFPAAYDNALLVLDWTFGRVHAIHLERDGASWSGKPTRFMEGTGTFGFAPTDVAIGPDGSLFVSVGGRGTQGGVYRVRYKGKRVTPSATTDIERALDAPQPLASWSRQEWIPLANALKADAFRTLAFDESATDARRVRAIEILTELFGGIPEQDGEFVSKLTQTASPLVRARAIWAIARSAEASLPTKTFVPFLSDSDPFVVRAALEALLESSFDWSDSATAALLTACGSKHRFVRQLAARVAIRVPNQIYSELVERASKSSARAVVTLAMGYAESKRSINVNIVDTALKVVEGEYSLELKREAVRVMQLALGDMGSAAGRPAAFDSYGPRTSLNKFERQLDPIRIRLGKLFPMNNAVLDLELSRLIGMLAPLNPNLLEKVLAKITPESHPTDDLHYLLVAARFPIERSFSQTKITANALVDIDIKVRQLQLKLDSNWDDRIEELYAALAKFDPALAVTAVDMPKFGDPGHVFLLQQLQPQFLERAIAQFVTRIERDDEYKWNTDIVFVLGESTKPEHLELIRGQYTNFAVRDAVLMTLAVRSAEEDRERFVDGLNSASTKTVEACIDGLARLAVKLDAEQVAGLIAVVRRLGREKSEVQVRDKAVKQLRRLTGNEFGYRLEAIDAAQSEVVREWSKWFRQQFPEKLALLGTQSATVDVVMSQLKSIDWSVGDAKRGQVLFTERRCAQCHTGSRGLGPDLSGVARRFSRDDLFTAILIPDRDVSPRYQTTIVETVAGKVVKGMVVYESVDGLTLRNAELQTIRLEAAEIEEQRRINTSLMPAGLLKDLKPSQLADLYAYMRQLGESIARSQD